MADDFILRIVLRAKDEIGSTLVRAKAELSAFGNEMGSVERKADTLNRRLDTLNRRSDTLVKRGNAVRQSLGVAGLGADDLEERLSKLIVTEKKERAAVLESSDAHLKAEAATKRATAATDESIKSTSELTKLEQRLAARREALAKGEADLARIQQEINERNIAALEKQTSAVDDLLAKHDKQVEQMGWLRKANEKSAATKAKEAQATKDQASAERDLTAAVDEGTKAEGRRRASGKKGDNAEKTVVRRTEGTKARLAKAEHQLGAARNEREELQGRKLDPEDEDFRKEQLADLDKRIKRLVGNTERIQAELDAEEKRRTKQSTVTSRTLTPEELAQFNERSSRRRSGTPSKTDVDEETQAIDAQTESIKRNSAARHEREETEAEDFAARMRRELEEDDHRHDLDAMSHGSGDDDIFLPGFGGIAGGASSKRDKERQEARERLANSERKKMGDIEAAYQSLSQKAMRWWQDMRTNEGTEKDWIFRLEQAEKKLRSLAGQAARLTTVDDKHALTILNQADKIRDRIKLAEQEANAAIRKHMFQVPMSVDATEAHAFAKDRAISRGEFDPEKLAQDMQELAKITEGVKGDTTDVVDEYEKFVDEIERGNVSQRDQRIILTGMRKDLQGIASIQRKGGGIRSESYLRAARAADEANDRVVILNKSIRDQGGVVNRTEAQMGSWMRRLEMLNSRMSHAGESIATIDNQMRGMVVLAVMTFAQQLITVLVSLAGALAAVGSSAVMAAGALGGSLAAGLAQSIPLIGLVIASLAKLKGIMDVVQQADLVQQQNFGRQNDNAKKLADTSDAVANANEGLAAAQDSLAAAHDNVAEAQKRLTKARQDGRDEIQRLIQAEKDAALAARGAALDEAGAQERLRQTVVSGDVSSLAGDEQGLLEAINSNQKSKTDLGTATRDRRRAATQGGVEGLDSVRQARKALDDARNAADKAAVGVTKAQRAVEKAARGSDAAVADQFSGLEKLQFLLAHLTPTQLKLFAAIQNIRATYLKNVEPILDNMIGEFARMVNTGNRLLKDPRVLGTLNVLTNEVVKQLGRLRKEFTGYGFVNQMMRIWEAGKENLKPLTDIVIALGHAWANIAEEAGPALNTIINYFSDLADRFERLTQDKARMTEFFNTGTEHFLAWADLIGSIIQLLAAFVGATADDGLGAIKSATKWIDGMTVRVRGNADRISGYVGDALRGTGTLLKVIGQLALAVLDAFDPDNLQNLADFITSVVIPPLKLAIEFVGSLSEILQLIANNPLLSNVAKVLVFLTLMSRVATGMKALFFNLGSQMLHIFTPIVGKLSEVLSLLGKIAKTIPSVSKVLEGAAGAAALVGISRGGRGGRGSGGGIDFTDLALLAGGQTPSKESGLVSKIFGRGGASGAAREAEVAGVKAGGMFTKAFNSPLGGLLKKAGWVGLGLSAFQGITSALKYGSIGAGVRDVMSSMTFGLIDSTAERIEKNIKKIKPAIERRLDAVSDAPRKGQVELPDEFKPKTTIARPGSFGRAGDIAGLARLRQVRTQTGSTEFDTWLDGLPKKLQKPIKRMIDMQDELRRFTTDKSLFGLQNLHDEADKLGAKFPELSDAVADFASKTEDAMSRVQQAMAPDRIAVDLGKQLQLDPKHWRSIVDDALNEADKLPPGLRQRAVQSIKQMASGLESQGDLPKGSAARIRERVNSEFDKMKDKSSDQSAKLASNVAKNMAALGNAMNIQMDFIGGIVNDALKAFGVGAAHFIKHPQKAAHSAGDFIGALTGLVTGSRAQGGFVRRAAGGIVSKLGQRGRDLVPTLLGKGEAVLNWAHQKVVEPAMNAYYGFGLDRMFNKYGAFHAGGPEQAEGFATGGFSNILHKHVDTPGELAIAKALDRMGKAMHVLFFATSGRRTPAENAQAGGAPHSMHLLGRAMDVGPEIIKTIARSVLNRFGIDRPVAYYPGHDERNHIELLGNRTGAAGDVKNIAGSIASAVGNALGVTKVPKLDPPLLTGTHGAMLEIANAGIKKATKAAHAFIQKKADSADSGAADASFSGISGGGNKAQNMRLAQRMAKVFGWVGAQWQALKTLWTGESGFDEGLANYEGSGAYGIAQALPSSKYPPAGQPGAPNGPKKAKAQIAWGLNYIKNNGNFHDPISALQFWLSHSPHWYQDGGGVPGSGPFGAVLHGGEHVWTAAEVMRAGGHKIMYALRSLLGGGGTQSKNPGSYAQGGATLAIGDSLMVGLAPYLKKLFKDITINAKGGRDTAGNLRALEEDLKKSYKRVIFESGTNNTTAAALKKALQTAFKKVGDDRNLLIPLLRGKGIDAAAKNKVIKEFADKHDSVGVITPRGTRGGDTIHYSPEGYKQFAKEIAKSSDGMESLAKDLKKIDIPFLTSSMRKRIKDVRDGLYNLGVIPVRTWEQALKEINRAKTAMQFGVRKFKHAANGLTTLANITRDGGLLDSLDAARDRLSTRMGRNLSLMTYKIRKVGDKFRISQRDNTIDVAERAVSQTQRQLGEIVGERGLVRRSLDRVNDRLEKLRKGGIGKHEATEARQLITLQQSLRTRFDAIQDAFSEGVTALAGAQASKVQAQVDKVIARADKRNSVADFFLGIGTTLGNVQMIVAAQQNKLGNYNRELAGLQKLVDAAKKTGNKELVDSLNKNISDLLGSIVDLTAQMLNDATARINAEADKSLSVINFASRMNAILSRQGGAGATAAAGKAIDLQGLTTQTLQTQRDQLFGQLIAATMQGNTQAADDLGKAILDLDGQIAESVQATKDLIVASDQLSLNLVTANATASVGMVQTGIDIVNKISDLAGKVDTKTIVRYLTIASATLTAAASQIADTITKAINDPNSPFGAFQGQASDILGGARDAFKDGPQAFAEYLATHAQQIADIEQVLGPDTPAGQLFQSLMDAMINNTNSTLDNTKSLKDLKASNNVQAWSSTAWTMFRQAIFTGTGHLLPSYQVPSAATGGMLASNGLLYGHVGEEILPAEVVRRRSYDDVSVGDFNAAIYVEEKVEEANPDVIANRLMTRYKELPRSS